jgi:hypothetical protein
MSKLLLTFYGDDFTGSTDALEQLTLAGIRTALFIAPPTPEQLREFPRLQAIGVAGRTRSLAPDAMERELKPALIALKKLGARHIHYKICSTFDSSPTVGSIGRVMDVAAKIFSAPFIPLLVAARTLHDLWTTLRALRHWQRGSDSSPRPASVHQQTSGHADDGGGLAAALVEANEKENRVVRHPESCVAGKGSPRCAQTTARWQAGRGSVRRTIG